MMYILKRYKISYKKNILNSKKILPWFVRKTYPSIYNLIYLPSITGIQT